MYHYVASIILKQCVYRYISILNIFTDIFRQENIYAKFIFIYIVLHFSI